MEHKINHQEALQATINHHNGEPIDSIEILRSHFGIKGDGKKQESAVEVVNPVPKQTFSDNLAYERDVNDPTPTDTYSPQQI